MKNMTKLFIILLGLPTIAWIIFHDPATRKEVTPLLIYSLSSYSIAIVIAIVIAIKDLTQKS